MKTTDFNIYQDTNGILRLENYTTTYPNENWEEYLKDTNQKERLERLMAMSSRKRSSRVNRLRKSQDFKNWQIGKDITVTSSLYGTAGANYDGRLPEWAIKNAILKAVKYNEKKAMYYPTSNAGKPTHLEKIYVFEYWFKKA